MWWAEHVALMGKSRKVCKVLAGNPEERENLEDRGVDGRM
jgi:hypothetical protein